MRGGDGMDEATSATNEERREAPLRPWTTPGVEWEEALESRIGFQLLCTKSPGEPICLTGIVAS